MAKISFMERLTLGIVVAVILFGVAFTWMTGITTAVNGIATYYTYTVPSVVNGTVTYIPVQVRPPFPQPFWELTLSFAIGFIPISIVIWDNHRAKENDTSEPQTTIYTADTIRKEVQAAFNEALPGILAKMSIAAQGSKKAEAGPPGTA